MNSNLTGRLTLTIAGNAIGLGVVRVPVTGFCDRGQVTPTANTKDVVDTVRAAVNALPNLLDALDVAEAAIERVRDLHRPMDVDALQYACAHEDCEHEFDCPTIKMTVCKGCYDLGENIDIYGYERGGIEYVLYPCPTIQALDGGE